MSNTRKVALITGVTGQDGAYLAEFLLRKGYEVHGLKRRSSLFNTERVDHLYQDPHVDGRNFFLHYGDLSDSMNITSLIKQIEPDEIYNLGAMSHVKVSFDSPEYTANVDALGVLRVLESIRLLGLEKKTRIYQASTSELFGLVQTVPQNEQTPFYPRSPYACAKLYAYWITVNYREAYGMHCSNGILFNHESPLRGETFVTRKITRSISRIAVGLQRRIYLGNLSATRDWGHAKDYVRSMYLILQQESAGDYAVATGITTSVRDFAKMSFAYIGMTVHFEGEGLDEVGVLDAVDRSLFVERVGEKYLPLVEGLVGETLVQVDPAYFRPTEVQALIGDASKARRVLGWEPEYSLQDIIGDMMAYDVRLMHREAYLKDGGYTIHNYFE